VHACDRARLVGMGRDARAAAEALDWRAVVGQLENLLHGVAAAVPTGARP
jgi:hypothetical protein